MSNEELKKGLDPLVVGKPKILVLGSLPGDKTIKENEKCNNGDNNEKSEPKYYCSSSNRFWKVVAALQGGNPVPAEYSQKVKLLESAGIALWDVYKKAVRAGALDCNIRAGQVNNFSELVQLLKKNIGIHTIVFNGVKASKVFSEKIRLKLQAELKDRSLCFLSLPSTSGASRKKTSVLVQEWVAKLGNV
jgi:hypoxanthine-DNA glycosylase